MATNSAVNRMYSLVAPFTYRDSATFLEILEAIGEWVKTIPEELNTTLAEFQTKIDQAIADLNAGNDAKIAELETFVLENIAELTTYVDSAVNQVIDNSIELQDSVMAGILDDNDSLTRSSLDEIVSDSVYDWLTTLQTVSVATEMKRTSESFEDCLVRLCAIGGLEIVLPAGDFTLNNFVRVAEGTHIRGVGESTILRKLGNPVIFVCNRIDNVALSSVKFVGRIHLGGGGVTALWPVNVGRVIVDDIVADYAVNDGHVIDLQGVDFALVTNSVFRGKSATQKHYSEAIQIDNSVLTGASGIYDDIVFDGAACGTVIVENCVSEGIGDFKAPKLVGSHSAVQHRPHGRVIVRGGAQGVTPIPSSPSATFRTGLSFVNTKSVSVKDFRMEFNANVSERPGVAIQLHTFDTGIALDEVNTPNAIPKPFESPVSGVFTNVEISTNVESTSDPTNGGYLRTVSADSRIEPWKIPTGRLFKRGNSAFLFYPFKISLANVEWARGFFADPGGELVTIPYEYWPPMEVTQFCIGPRGKRFLAKISNKGVVSVSNYDSPDGLPNSDLLFSLNVSYMTSV